jgi:hypothetical protein
LTAADPTFGIGRKRLIALTGPMLPSALINLPGGGDKLDGFEQALVDLPLARRGMETRSVAALKANQQAYLRQAARRSKLR